jgi:hypothetical protein
MKEKLDLYGNKIIVVKCIYCGKIEGHHKAATYNCPMGTKHRSLGYTSYNKEHTFTKKEEV